MFNLETIRALAEEDVFVLLTVISDLSNSSYSTQLTFVFC